MPTWMTSGGAGFIARYCVRTCAVFTAPMPVMMISKLLSAPDDLISVDSSGVAARTSALDVIVLRRDGVGAGRDALDDDRQAEERDDERRGSAGVDADADERLG